MSGRGREKLRGRPLLESCKRANCSGVEYTIDDTDFFGCYGLMDQPYLYNEECVGCGAFVLNVEYPAKGHVCASCGHSNIERHTGDDTLTCWVHKSHGVAVNPLHYCGWWVPENDCQNPAKKIGEVEISKPLNSAGEHGKRAASE